jgi:hypothetical protein
MLLSEYCEDIDKCADGKCRGDHKQCINTLSGAMNVVVVKDIKRIAK